MIKSWGGACGHWLNDLVANNEDDVKGVDNFIRFSKERSNLMNEETLDAHMGHLKEWILLMKTRNERTVKVMEGLHKQSGHFT
nr:uncharacterized protein CI109_004352 [Kwoniella shandongensis]KAA5527292.1 hypothetical protein CI109_004352 [Kwoniella shandongensis]